MFSVVFPAACSLCGRELLDVSSLSICSGCWESLERWTEAACEGCGLPLASGEVAASADSRCGQCRTEGYEFERARSYGPYVGRLRAAILQLKFRERLANRLGELLVPMWYSVAELQACDGAVLVPVPLHRSRRRERGFNQAELLAEVLARHLDKKPAASRPRLEARCLVRTRATLPQTGLTLSARRENVRGVFSVALPERVRGRVAVLVDDVMTTGATLSACAAALHRVGAGFVIALTLARASPQFPDVVSLHESVSVDELRSGST